MSETPPLPTLPDWQARASAYAEAYTAWSHAVVETMLPITESFSATLRHAFDVLLPLFRANNRRLQRRARRDLHRAYRRRYHQRPPLTRRDER